MSTVITKTSPRVSFASMTPNNLGTVRKLNSVLFPIKYSERFYRDILQPEAEDFCKLIYFNDIPMIKPICGNRSLMDRIQPYRSRGLGSQSLQSVLEAAENHAKPKIQKIYLHVQVSNDSAKAFYERHGFMEVEIHKDYYKKIDPHDAWVLEKIL
ncbi:N-acetyltransferase 5 [Leucoagaricus gongylophorus]